MIDFANRRPLLTMLPLLFAAALVVYKTRTSLAVMRRTVSICGGLLIG